MLDTLWPLDDGLTYRFPANVRRRYEKLRRFPDGLLVAGDAMCAFDPAFGQGMTVAALEAWELHGCLRTGSANLAQRYFRRAAAHIDTPWTITVGVAPRPVRAYQKRLLAAAVHDQAVATAFLRVNHLLDAPTALMRPAVMWRVARASVLAGRGGERGREAGRQRLEQGGAPDAARSSTHVRTISSTSADQPRTSSRTAGGPQSLRCRPSGPAGEDAVGQRGTRASRRARGSLVATRGRADQGAVGVRLAADVVDVDAQRGQHPLERLAFAGGAVFSTRSSTACRMTARRKSCLEPK